MMSYWSERSLFAYYQYVREELERLGPRPSLLDVGCWDTPVATWGDFGARFSIDPRPRPPLPNVVAITGSWPQAAQQLPHRVSVVTCLQLLEHVRNTRAFCASLFARATDVVILSVPYRWPRAACEYHIHDPIDEAKLAVLTGLPATRTHIVDEPDGYHRLIAVYEVQA
jgi:hypothetical protein